MMSELRIFKYTLRKTIQDDTDNQEFLICNYEFPQLSSNFVGSVEDQINNDIKDEVMPRYISHCNTGLYTTNDFLGTGMISFPLNWLPLTEQLSYEITRNSNSYLSIVFEESLWYGGAHPSTEQFSLTYDITTGKRVTAEEVLHQSELDVKKRIVSLFLKQFEETPERFFEDRIRNLTHLNFHYQFYLTEEELIVYFNPYELAPYASGVVHIAIPLHTKKE